MPFIWTVWVGAVSQAVIKSGVVPILVHHLIHQSMRWYCAHLLNQSKSQCSLAIPPVATLSSRRVAVARPALRTLGNVASGNNDCTQYAIDCGIIPACKELLRHDHKVG